MYELDGKEYSLEDITAAAEESNLTFEDYIAKAGIVKTNGDAETDASVSPEKNTASISDPGSLDLSKMNIPKPLKDKIEPSTPAQIKIDSEKRFKSTLKEKELDIYNKSNIIPENYFEIDADVNYKPEFSKRGNILNKPKTKKLDENEMQNVVNTTDGIYKNILLSPKNFGLPFASQSEIASYEYSPEEIKEIQEVAYKSVIEKTGLKISKDDFVSMYSSENITLLQDVVGTSQKINNARLALNNDVLNTKFKDEQVNIFYNSKSTKEQAKINEVAKIREAQKNVIETESQINGLKEEDESYESKLKALNIQLSQQKAIIKKSNELIERNATTTTSIMSAGGVPQQVTNIDESLKSLFLKKGYTQSSIDRILQAKNTIKATASTGTSAIKITNPDLTDEEALTKYFDSQILRKQNLIKENSEKVIPFDFKKLTYPTDLESQLKSIGIFANNNGITEVTPTQLKQLGFSSENFEGLVDSKFLGKTISEEDLSFLKASEQSLDDVEGDLLGLYDMIYQNTDPANLQKPGFVKNIVQNAVIATAMEFGASPEEAENLSTLGQGKRNRFMLDKIDEVTREYNTANPSDTIQFTDEQKKNIERTFMEEVEEGTGQMVPVIGKIIGLTTLTGGAMNVIKGSKWFAQALKNGTGYENLMAKVLQSKGMGLAIEEANMQMVGFEPGTGLSFGVGRILAKPITLSKVTGGRLPALNPLFEKVPKAGVIGALSSELATTVGLGYEDLMDNKDFSNEFEILYGDLEETTKRLLVNSMVFGIAGVGSVKKTDLMSTGAKLSAIKDIEVKKQELLGKDLLQETGPDGKTTARQKNKEDLNSADKKKYEALESAQVNLQKLYLNEAFEGDLDVNSPEFESNFKKRFTEPMTKAIQNVIPEFKGFNTKFGSGEKFRNQYFEKDANGKDTGNTAEWDPDTNTVYFDKAKYNTGKPLHEFTHIAMGAYFQKNPTAKRNFTKKMEVLFKDFEIGDYKGAELMEAIKEKYGKDKELNAEEYLAFMTEFLANPDVYYSKVAPNFIKEITAEINDILVETGMSKFAPKPTNAKEFIELLASLGQSARKGTKLEVKASTLAKLEDIDFLGIEYVDTKKAVETVKKETKASKDLFQQTDKVYKENKELWTDKEVNKAKRDRVIAEMAYKWENEIDRKMPTLENFSKSEIKDIVFEFVTAEKRGLRDLMDKFDQQKLLDKDGNPYESISAYLNTPGIIQKRLIEFYKDNPNFNKIRKSLEDESVKELTNVKNDIVVETAFKDKQGKLNVSERFNIDKEVDVVIDKLSANELTATNYKNTINRVEEIVNKKLTPQFISQPANAKTIYDALPKSIMSTGRATGVKRALIKAFYKESDIRTDAVGGKSKQGLTEQSKQPFNREVWENFVNRRTLPNGKLERINDQLNPRLKAIRQEFGKAVTNQAKTKMLKKEFEGNPALETVIEFVSDGKSPILASKLLRPARKFMDKLKTLTNVKDKKALFNKQPEELKEALDNIILSAGKEKDVISYIDKLNKEQVLLETKYLEKYSKDFDISLDQARKEIVEGEMKWKPVRKRLKLSEGGKNTIASRKRVKVFNKQFVKDMIPEGMTFKELPKNMQQTIIDTVGFGDTRFTQQGRPLTYKEYQTQKDYSKLLETVYGKDVLIGSGKKLKNELGETIDLNAIYGPRSWGKQGISGKIRSIVSQKNITPAEARKQVEKLLSAEGFSIDKTLEANVALLKNAYQSLVNKVIKNPNKETLSDVVDLMEAQVNRATSIFKGMVPMRSFNMKPEQSLKGKNREKVLHNEHLRELFQANKDIVIHMNDFISKKMNKETLIERVDKAVLELEQASISERMRETKDASGASKRDFYDPLTFLGRDAINQIPIGSYRKGNNMVEAIVNSLKPKQKAVILNTPSSKLNSDGIQVKQRLEYPKDYKEVKTNNDNIAKKAGIKDSKKMNQGELFLELSKKDKENAKKIKERFASKDLSKEFNDILEQSSGVESVKEFSDIRAKTIGKNKRKWQLFIPDSAADLNGLIDVTLGKGKKGDAQRKWYKDNVLDPFNNAEYALTRDRVTLTSGFKALKKQLKVVPKDLRKEAIEGFTFEQAIRVHTWNKQGMKVEGLSKRDLKELSEIIEKNPELNAFSEQLIELGKGKGYPEPPQNWLAGSISTDLRTGLNKGGRAKYLEATGYTENINKIYSKENLNKLEALYGTKYRVALENMLGRMKTGINRKPSANALENRALDWINNANGVTMFLNARSAVLQTISSLNYINWTDNNPLKAGKALANQPQYWKDFMEIMNSDYLVDRRNGLKLNVSESEIADAAKSSANGAKGAINYLLSKGFMFTRIADSFAIASGGSTFYRNRINTYKKQGLSEAQAKEKAFKDFREISEVSQQSANVSKISMEQSSSLGRLVLAFANTPMQYARLQKSAIKDLANGRGDYKANLSKVMYYGFVQNLMFNALQNALFTNIWEDNPDPIKEDMKKARIANGMADSILRGMGIGGAGVSTIKNVLLKIKSESEKSRPDYNKAAMEVFDFIPPIDSKIRKLRNTATSFKYDKDDMESMSLMDIDNPAYLAGANVISAATNFPADRLIKKTQNMKGILTDEMEMWQRIARFAGWSQWEIGPEEPKKKKDKTKKKLSWGSSSSKVSW
jgi:hypothetical protein